MTKPKETKEVPVIEVPRLQLTLRRALLDKAGPETKNKFTGKGYGDNLILWDDAECIIATVMDLIAAKRNNTEIVVDGARYRADEYKTYGDGLAKCMNWNGVSYYSEVDDERPEKSLVVTEFPGYKQDFALVNDKVVQAGGCVVSPDKLDQLISGFNGLNGKIGEEYKIKVGSAVDKAYIKFGNFNYLYVDGDVRRVAEETEGYGLEFATLLQPRVKFSGVTIGSMAEEAADQKVLEWLL